MKIPGGQHQVQFGTTPITFDLLYSQRKTLAIHVYPDCTVTVDAPKDTPMERIRELVLKRGAWILRHQRQFQDYAPVISTPRQFVSGETWRYLGRQYRLRVEQGAPERVILTRGWITVTTAAKTDTRRVEELLMGWYRRQAQRVFAERWQEIASRIAAIGVTPPETFRLREMKSRWGSCSSKGQISLNLKLIQVDKSLIDYVILHELCHLRELNHSRAFYALLDRVVPDWKKLRAKLNKSEVSF
jgi:predicted metal-dependent hydrolase